jgi:hypothetical protein
MFLQDLYRHWKKMFYALLVLALAQAFFMYKAVETVPFFLYNMYSTRQHNGDTSYRTAVYLNGHLFNTAHLSGHEQETIFGSLSYFKKLQSQHYFATDSITVAHRLKLLPAGWYQAGFDRLTNTSVSEGQYLDWLARYLAQVSGEAVDSFSLVTSTVLWKPAYRLVQDTVSLINYSRAPARH